MNLPSNKSTQRVWHSTKVNKSNVGKKPWKHMCYGGWLGWTSWEPWRFWVPLKHYFQKRSFHIFETHCFFPFLTDKFSDETIEDQWGNEQNSVVLGGNCCENILRELVDEFDRDQMIPGIRYSRRWCNRWPMVINVYIYMGDSLNCGTPQTP